MEWVNLLQLARNQKQLFCIPTEPTLVGANYVLLVSEQARVDKSTTQVGQLLLKKLISLYPCK